MMDATSLTDPNAILARRLRAARKARGLSLQAAADLTGVSRSMLSQIERAESSPTLSTVWNLARAFEVDVARLVGEEARGGIAVRRAAEQPLIDDSARGVRMRILSAPAQAGRLELYDIDLDAGAQLASAPHWAGCREQIMVLAGGVAVQSGEDETTLGVRDVAEYAADVPHCITAGEQPARLMLLVHGAADALSEEPDAED